MSAQKTLVTNSFWSLASHLLSRGTLMLVAIIVARTMPTPDFAAYSYFQMTVAMIGAYAALGLGTTASRFFAEVGHGETEESAKPLGALWTISVIVSMVAGLMVFAVPSSWVNANLGVPQWLMAVGVTVTALGVVPGGALLGLEQYRAATVISFFHGAVLIIATLLAARQQAPELAMLAFVLGAFVQAAGQFAIVLRYVGWKRISKQFFFRRRDVADILHFAGPMFLVTLMSASGSWFVGRIILRGVDGAHNFALYSIGLQWYSLALLLPGMISRVVLPRIIRTSKDKDCKEPIQIVRSGIILASLAGGLVSLVGVFIGPFIGSMYGMNYQIDRLFIAAYMGAALFSAPTNTIGNAILANDGQLFWLKNTAVWFIFLFFTTIFFAQFSIGHWTGCISHAFGGIILLSIAYIHFKKMIFK